MDESQPIYNSRIIKIFLEYLDKFYPEIDSGSVLESAGISRYEVEDQAHWFRQEQVDEFHNILVARTGNPDIAREAGQYAVSAEAFGWMKQHILGLVNQSSIYLLMEKLYPLLSRGATVTARKLGSNEVEIVSVPKPGVEEKQYQCENRLGSFESVGKLFTGKVSSIKHPECFHRGDKFCRYVISCEEAPSRTRRRIRNYSFLAALPILAILFFVLPETLWNLSALLGATVLIGLSWQAERLEKRELLKTIEEQGDSAREHLEEVNIRYNNALLVQEIGQATSTMRDITELIRTVCAIMQKRLGFDRGAVLLATGDKSRLAYTAGYGYNMEQEEYLRGVQFGLDNPHSKGILVRAFREQRPFLLDDIDDVKKTFSARSATLADSIDVRALICVPVIYEKETLGIIAVDNSNSKRSLTQSDMNLLMGVASQTAVSIANAVSFQKLRESETKYRDLVENANSIILRMDIQGRITFYNEFAQRFFGYTEDEILGRSIIGAILPDSDNTRSHFSSLIRMMTDEPERHAVSENESRLQDGSSVWIAWTYKPIFNAAGKLSEILCIGNDVTELKRASREKKELEAQLQRAQKMEALGTLAGGVAHDLNNILTAIVSYPELILINLPDDSPLRKPLERIKRSGEKAAAVVQDLLTLARRGVAATEVVNINTIFKEYLRSPEYENLVLNNPRFLLETHLDKDLFNIVGSPVHLSKTLMNLISNSVEAMPGGGRILISTENRYVDRPVRGYTTITKGEYVIFRISDTGVGISKEDRERIFEPFYTKKVMGRSGSGLGMAVVWGTVKDHRGYIDLESIPGRGTIFTLYFPATRRDLISDEASQPLEYFMSRGETILVIDDEEDQREIASEMLKHLGYLVDTVASGEEAVEYLKSRSATLVVLDMIMDNGMDGLETYRKILELHPGQKAVIASGYSETDRLRETQRLGAGRYLKKPYLLEQIGLAVRAELDKPDRNHA